MIEGSASRPSAHTRSTRPQTGYLQLGRGLRPARSKSCGSATTTTGERAPPDSRRLWPAGWPSSVNDHALPTCPNGLASIASV